MERGLLFLADSKTGRKTVILNAPAMAVLADLDRMGTHVVPGDDPGKPRADLKRPWEAVAKRAGLSGVRLHDLRHTYASFGAGGGLGLPIIGKLLGHTQASTTQRYAHLDADPLRRASEAIGGRIAAALEGRRSDTVLGMKKDGAVALRSFSRQTVSVGGLSISAGMGSLLPLGGNYHAKNSPGSRILVLACRMTGLAF